MVLVLAVKTSIVLLVASFRCSQLSFIRVSCDDARRQSQPIVYILSVADSVVNFLYQEQG